MNASSTSISIQMETWPIDRLIPYVRNPRKNDKAVDRMCASIREFGFKIPYLVRSDGEVVDGHLRLKAARKLGLAEIPVILCDDWTPAQVKAFRLMVNKSVSWAKWDEELLALELQEIQGLDFNLDLTGFDVPEIEDLLALPDGEEESMPPLPEVATSRAGDLWLLGEHRVLCGDATSPEMVERLLDGHRPLLMVTDPPYGIELDSEWRDRAGLNGCGMAEAVNLRRTEGHQNTSISSDTRADWSEAFALVPSLEVAYVSASRRDLAREFRHRRPPGLRYASMSFSCSCYLSSAAARSSGAGAQGAAGFSCWGAGTFFPGCRRLSERKSVGSRLSRVLLRPTCRRRFPGDFRPTFRGHYRKSLRHFLQSSLPA